MIIASKGSEPGRFYADHPQSELDDLYRRLSSIRWPSAETVDDESQGLRLSQMQALVDHWLSAYVWRRCEALLNNWGQYKTDIDDLGIHYIHIRSPEPDAIPMIMTHGWPESVLEFRDVIGPLSDPASFGGDRSDAFHLVIPSLPGFGYSDKPTKLGWNIQRTARVWDLLMRHLGYGRWVAQGGDWGAGVTTELGFMAPPGLSAIHLNMVLFEPTEEERGAADLCEQEKLAGAKEYERIAG